MRRMRGLLFGLVLCCGMAAAATSPTPKIPSPQWLPQGDLVMPPVPAGVPVVSAGCLIIGHHIRTDGSVAAPRVLRGAFTANVNAQQIDAYTAAALRAAYAWRFRFDDKHKKHEEPAKPQAMFHMQTAGFAPAMDGGQLQLLSDLAKLPGNVREQCQVADLAAWGEANAIPVEQARQKNGDKILVKEAGNPAVYWTSIGGLKPPTYPSGMVMALTDACIVVGFTVGADGVPDKFRIMSSKFSGPVPPPTRKGAENNAVFAASQWRFSPGPDNLIRMPEFMQVPISYRIRGQRQLDCAETDLRAVVAAVDEAKPDSK